MEVVTKKGVKVLIDREDLALANNGKGWSVRGTAIQVCYYLNGKPRYRYLHRIIMSPPKGMSVDHINGDPMDNRRKNLRVCTHAENMCNRRAEKVGSKKIHLHGFKGIIKNRKPNLKKPWIALISKKGAQHYSGYFATPEEAAKAYDELARKYHGEFARLNFPDT